jgi:hypothetical protein
MRLFTGGVLVHDEHEAIDIERTKKRMMHYYWQEYTLYFQNLMVLKPKDKSQIIKKCITKLSILKRQGPFLRLNKDFLA